MNLLKRFGSYVFLISFISIALWEYLRIVGDIYMEWFLILLVVAFYVVWGYWVHKEDHRYHPHVIQEYLLVGLLVAMIFYVISVL